jgi:hypothetical protein
MIHPQHKDADIRKGDARSNMPGSPERWPAVEVRNADEEDMIRAKGYLRYGEAMPERAGFNEYPIVLSHPEHVDDIPATYGMKMEGGRAITYPIPMVPGKYPDVTANTPSEKKEWEAKGYVANGVFDERAFEKATVAAGKPGDEWPRWEEIDGQMVLVQDPENPPLGDEYPKYIHFDDGVSIIANDPAHEKRILASHISAPHPVKQPDKPYVALTEPNAEFEEFLAWKAWKTQQQQPASVPERESEREPDRSDEEREAEERETLLALAAEANIKVDKRWGISRLREVVMGETQAAE